MRFHEYLEFQCLLKVNMDHTWIGTLNICRGISSLSFWVNALPTAYAWKEKNSICWFQTYFVIVKILKIKYQYIFFCLDQQAHINRDNKIT